MTFVSLTQNSGPTWSCTDPGAGNPGTIACTNASVAVNTTSVFTLVGHIPAAASPGATYTNTAMVTSDADNNPENDSSTATATVVSNAPTLTTQASSATTIGGSISDTATLSGSASATGTISFFVYGPDDATCGGGAVFNSTVDVNGDGTYNSGSFTPTVAGTYRFVALYSGDDNNKGTTTSCGDANESVVVAKQTPTFNTQASAATTIGNGISDNATVSGSFSATGTITFNLYGPNNASCGGAAIFTSTVTVNGDGTYTSASFTPTAPGTYRWTATYTGDGNNNGAASLCNAANESAVVSKATPALSTQASPATSVGTSISDKATISAGSVPTGTIVFNLYGPNDATCGGSVIFSSTVAVNGNGAYTSASFTVTAAGTYRWIAIYSGDASNNTVTSPCNAPGETVTVGKTSPSITTAASPSSINLGSGSVSDVATISNGVSPTGTVTFTLFGPNNSNCSGTPVFTSTKTVNANGSYSSDPFTPTAIGTYNWVASYTGDAK